MTEQPVDLSPLDPLGEPERFERLVRAISIQAVNVLAARQLRRGIMGEIATWRLPMLAAASVVIAISITVLARVQATSPVAQHSAQIAEAVGVPTQIAQWIRSDEVPTTDDLLELFGGKE